MFITTIHAYVYYLFVFKTKSILSLRNNSFLEYPANHSDFIIEVPAELKYGRTELFLSVSERFGSEKYCNLSSMFNVLTNIAKVHWIITMSEDILFISAEDIFCFLFKG